MNNGQNIHEELTGMGSILAGLPRTMPYVVPAGYFDNVEELVRETIQHVTGTDIVPTWSKTLPYTIPEGYFTALPYEIAEKAAAENPSQEATIDAPYAVPTGYFETFPAQMLQAAKTADITATPKRRILSGPVKWLAAAILVLGLGFASYRILYNNQQAAGSETLLASVPNTDIQDYLQRMYPIDMDRLASAPPVNTVIVDDKINVDDKDIIEYLDETGWD